jgi:protein ImuA
MRAELSQLVDDGRVWRGRELAALRAEPSGFAQLDVQLPGGGWPCGALSEILYLRPGVGELSLVLPMLARLTQSGKRVAFVAPPLTPCAPALAQAGLELARVLVIAAPEPIDALWAAEQLLRARAAAVLIWARRTDGQALRRLQLAAEAGQGLALLYRPESAARESSPAALRLRVWREAGSPRVELFKRRGGHAGQRIALVQ